SGCFVEPVLVTVAPESFGSPQQADGLLRGQLFRRWKDCLPELAQKLSWAEKEVAEYFAGVQEGEPIELLNPQKYREHYFDSVLPGVIPRTGLPQQVADAPLVSWLVPARNCEHFIMDCLRSIEAQVGLAPGCQEVVVVEDASEDGTYAVLHRFAESRPHVRIIESDGVQRGVAGCLREAWDQSRGAFLARLDADDEAEPDRLVKQLRYMEQHPTVSILGGRHRSFFSEERKFTVEKVSKKEDGRVVAAVWREFHGQQTSRAREQICLAQRGEEVVVVDGPAEYSRSRILRIGQESTALHPDGWREALEAAQAPQGGGEVLLLRSDPPEPTKGSTWREPWHAGTVDTTDLWATNPLATPHPAVSLLTNHP
ncbi:unnamed protein product, partial [Effrenium voratum]